MLERLPKTPGQYVVAQYIKLNVTKEHRTWFDIDVRYTRDGIEKRIRRKLYLVSGAGQDAFLKAQNEAIEECRKVYRELRSTTAELGDVVEIRRVEYERRKAQQAKLLEERVKLARRDVQHVWAIYGPALNMREPFYIFQWGG